MNARELGIICALLAAMANLVGCESSRSPDAQFQKKQVKRAPECRQLQDKLVGDQPLTPERGEPIGLHHRVFNRCAPVVRPRPPARSFFAPEITMPKVNLSGMTVEALMDLRKRVDEMLHERRAELEKQLERMGVVGGRRVVRGRASALKGKKVPPKYRGPSGETWAGRGARPRWLVAAIKRGRKLDDFLIDKSARKRKRRSKR